MSHNSFIQKIANHIQSHYDLAKEELTVVFPNKRAAYYLRNAIKTCYQQTIWLPQMLSIEEAVTEWSGITLADSIDLIFELIDIDAELHKEQDSDLTVFGSQAAQMAKDFNEIDQYGIDAHHVFSYILENKRLEYWNFDEKNSNEKEIKYLQFFHSLYDYYLRLRMRLSAQNKGYYGMITRQLAELPEAELIQKTSAKRILFAGFNALTVTEERIINTLLRNNKAEILFDYDAYYLDDPNNEAGLFARRYRQDHPEWLKNGISNALSTEKKTIHIVAASGNTLQTKALQANLQNSQQDDSVVILADENLLIPVLNAIPDCGSFNGIKVSMGYPISKTPVNQFVKEYMSLRKRSPILRKVVIDGKESMVEGWYIWPVIRLMDLEIVKIIFPKVELAAYSQWKTQAVKNGKFVFGPNDINSIKGADSIQHFLNIVFSHYDIPSPQSVIQSVRTLLQYIANRIQDNDTLSGGVFLLNQLSEVEKTINRLTQIAERNHSYIKDINGLETLYRLLSSSANVKLNSKDTEGLQIMGLLETRNLDFKHVHLLSVNEGILPADKSQSSFIPHFIRRECGLTSYVEKQAVFAYHFYHLLQSGEDIHLYYNNLGESSGGEASRFILQIKHELAQNANIHIKEESFSCKAEPSVETIALAANKSTALERLHYLIEKKGISPSALSTYLICPLKYYLRYVAQIEDNSAEEEIGSNVIGTVIHDTLELLFADYQPIDGTPQIIDKALFDKVIAPQWEQKVDQAIAKNLPNGFPDVGFNYLNKTVIQQQLKSYLHFTSKQLAENNLVILETEGELQAMLHMEQGDCLFKGRTDRIDQWGSIYRVIDYKTGHVESADLKLPVRHQGANDLEYLKKLSEKGIQLLLYKYMYLKQYQNIKPKQVEAAIHGLRYGRNIEFVLTKAAPTKADSNVDATFLEGDRFLGDMEAMLAAVIAEMLDPQTPFMQAQDDKKCGYCEFKLICKRE